MRIRFYHARIMTMQEDCSITEGELWVEDDRIVYIGKGCFVEDDPRKCLNAEALLKCEPGSEAWLDGGIFWDNGTLWRESGDIPGAVRLGERWAGVQYDCQGNLLMPGFKDAHAHTAMVAMRSYADDLPLQEWLNTKIFPLEAKMTPQDNYELTQLGNMEYLTSGITASFDMYLEPEAIARCCEEMGMRSVLVSGLNDFGGSVALMEERYLSLNRPDSLVSYMMGVHAEYTCSKGLLQEVSALLHQYKAPLYAHMSETRLETEQCVGRYGMTPPALFDSLGLFDFGGGAYHCCYFTEEDMDLFARRGLYIVTNPGSNSKLASGIAPITKFMEKGLCIAIGTDGASSNNALDMFREMYLVSVLAKLKDMEASAADADEVLRMATVNGAEAMGLKECTVLAPGKKADLILIDLHQPNMQPLNNISKNLVYSGSKQNVVLTMINGKILYKKGEFRCGVDPEKVYARANEIIARLGA